MSDPTTRRYSEVADSILRCIFGACYGVLFTHWWGTPDGFWAVILSLVAMVSSLMALFFVVAMVAVVWVEVAE